MPFQMKQQKLPREALQTLVGNFRQRRYADVVRFGQTLLMTYPQSGEILNLVGLASVELKNWPDAADYFRRSVLIQPKNAATLQALANVYHNQGKNELALTTYKKALELNPDNADTHYNTALVALTTDDPETAIAHLENVVRLKPGFKDAREKLVVLHFTRGVVTYNEENLDAAEACFQSVIRLDEGHYGAQRGLGVIYLRRFQYAGAERHFKLALKADPQQISPYLALGDIYTRERRFENACDIYTKGLEVDPEHSLMRSSRLFAKAKLCDWSCFEEYTHYRETLGSDTGVVSHLGMMAMADEPDLALRRARWAYEHLQAGKPELTPKPFPAPALRKHERIRVGYFSVDFYTHPVMILMAGVFEKHDHDRFDFRAYSCGPRRDDPMRDRVIEAFPSFSDVELLTDQAIAEKARADDLDIAVDLTGRTSNSRLDLFALRPAPVQVSYLGYSATMGSPAYDYIIGDEMLIPKGFEDFYSENPLRLPECYMPSDDTRVISDREMTRAEYGLPEDGFVFCSFNQTFKIGPRDFDIWMRLLSNVEGSVLWLSETPRLPRDRLRNEAQRRGVDPDRLVFADRPPIEEHLARQRLADLFLDTGYYNAHTTTNDALWAGLPVLTRPGRQFAARVAASLLNAVDMPELIVKDDAEYEALALELARDPDRLSALRAKLAENIRTAPLFDTERYTRHLEKAYEMVYDRYQEGLDPAPVTVPPLEAFKDDDPGICPGTATR